MSKFYTKSTNYKDRKAFDSFEDHLKWVRNATPINVKESEEDREKRKRKARKDYRYFVSEFFPHYATAKCATFQVVLANLVLKYPKLRCIVAWFRFAGKSVHTNIFIPMWLKIQSPKQFHTMVLVSKSYENAKRLLGDLQAELQENGKYNADFGKQLKMGHWEDGSFTTKDGCTFVALGLGQSPRGLRNRQHRPDFIVLDDIDDDQTVQNELLVDKRIEWIYKALIPSMDVGRGRVLIPNNIMHEKSIVAKLVQRYKDNIEELKQLQQEINNPKNTHFHISKVNIRDTKGRLTWPEKFTKQEVDSLEMELGYAVAQTELYNNPITEGRTFKREWFQFAKPPTLNHFEDIVCYYDGGYKNTGTSDSKSLVCIGILKGQYWLLKTYTGKATRMEAVNWHYDMYEWLKSHSAVARWFMEVAFMLDILHEDFQTPTKHRGYPIPLMNDKRKKPDKDLRIQSIAGVFERGNFYVNKAEESNHHTKAWMEQFLVFQPGKKTLKDAPDATEGGMHLLQSRVATMAPPVVGRRGGNKWNY
ncbi:MAG: hypothetical protein AAFY41_07095 [Bacteroidota bacterium]